MSYSDWIKHDDSSADLRALRVDSGTPPNGGGGNYAQVALSGGDAGDRVIGYRNRQVGSVSGEFQVSAALRLTTGSYPVQIGLLTLWDGNSLASVAGYQLGLQNGVGAPGAVDTTYIYNVEEPERASDDLLLDFHTGVALTSNIDLDIRSIFRFGENEIAGSVSESQSSTWPALTLSWKGIERWGLLRSLLKQSSLTARFERKYAKTIRREETAYQFSPTWNMTWKNTMTTNVAFTYNQKSWMEALQEMWSKNWGINIDVRYSFEGSKGIGLPLPFLSSKKLTFKSRLDTTLNLSLSRTMTYKLKPTTVFGISPQASYQFSNKIRGTLQLNYARTSGGQLGYIFHKVGMQVSLEFNF